MKQNPTNSLYTQAEFFKKIVLFAFFLFSMELFASSYVWSLSANKERAYVNEAIYLSYVCEFSDRAELYAVEFDPIKSDENLTLVMLSQRSKIKDGKKRVHYEFVAFVHKEGLTHFAFEAVMKKTTQESIDNTVIGRDNGKYAEYQSTKVSLESIAVEVIKAEAPLVGAFALKIKSDTPELKALTPYHMEVRLEGVGNFASLKPLAFEIEGVKIFSEEPMQKVEIRPEGHKGFWSQKFAFVSEKDFVINPFEIVFLNPKTHKKETLRFDGVAVRIKEGYAKESLLDLQTEQSGVYKSEYLYYLLTFLTGFLVSKIKFTRKIKQEPSTLCAKIKKVDSLEALSILLVLEDAQKYSELLHKIETKELNTLAKAKRFICG